mgnify:CR=1 FL=1
MRKAGDAPAAKRVKEGQDVYKGVRLTHPDRVLYPKVGSAGPLGR